MFALLKDIERAIFQLQQRIQILAVQRFGQIFILHRQQHLDDAGNAGGGFRMADIDFTEPNAQCFAAAECSPCS